MEKTLKNRQNQGITLIALVITIIVMLILVAVTVTMAVNGGLFGKAQFAGTQTNEAVRKEQELGSGKLNIAGKPYDSPQDYVDSITGGNKGTPLPTTENGVGYYADIDGVDGIDGIIYADMAFGNTKGGQWGDSNGTYNIPVKSNLKEYNLSNETVTGPFGPKKVVTLANNDETKNDRFYVMALDDVGSSSEFSWTCDRCWIYDGASELTSSGDFGYGQENTLSLISWWKNHPSGEGAPAHWKEGHQTSIPEFWGEIDTPVANGWFVPSRAEWSAFGQELGITSDNYPGYGLSGWYWTSSTSPDAPIFTAWFDYEKIKICDDPGVCFAYLRLSRIF